MHYGSNTYTDTIHPSVSDFMHNTKLHYSPECIAILSNSVGTEDDFQFKGAIATELAMNIPVIRHKQKKPACLDEVVNIRLLQCAILAMIGSPTYVMSF